jgi:nicotinate-nucleotide adenylyltransferase
MSAARRVGLLGGTFDPVHVGHLAAAEAARAALLLDEVLLLTSHVPPHRPQPRASVHHRFAMVALAIQTHDALKASDFELIRPGPSFTANTLACLHAAGYDATQLFFITGSDALAEIATWREYPGFLDAAHFVVVDRADRSADTVRADVPAIASRLIDAASCDPADPRVMHETRIFLVKGGTPDVSSTEIRRRCLHGRSITGLVPRPVERHIERHGLYAGARPDTQSADAPDASATVLHEQEQS